MSLFLTENQFLDQLHAMLPNLNARRPYFYKLDNNKKFRQVEIKNPQCLKNLKYNGVIVITERMIIDEHGSEIEHNIIANLEANLGSPDNLFANLEANPEHNENLHCMFVCFWFNLFYFLFFLVKSGVNISIKNQS